MARCLEYGFWTWSRWWAWRRHLGRALGAAVHRRHLRPQDRAGASAGANPSVLALRRLPCASLAFYRMRSRRRRSVPQSTGT